jgi:hypothetical protein
VDGSPWNSLEVARLLASLLTPAAIAYVGYLLQKQLASQNRVVQRRIEVYEAVGESLNRIYCFIEDIGDFRNDTPESIVAQKRKADGLMHAWQAIWPEDTFAAYGAYIDAAFEHFGGGAGQSARIRTTDAEKAAGIPNWSLAWSRLLTQERDPEHADRYKRLIDLILRDILRPERRSLWRPAA